VPHLLRQRIQNAVDLTSFHPPVENVHYRQRFAMTVELAAGPVRSPPHVIAAIALPKDASRRNRDRESTSAALR
jgi:hypothetical protein